MSTAVRSHAKINLGLYIGAPRADGFHSLATVYQTLEMHDVVTVTARHESETSIRLTSNDKRVPTDNRNTAWKMVSLALEELGITAEVEIHIEKRLPVQGGLGAGSANAVAALVGLEKELGIRDQGPGVNAEGRAFPLIGQNAPDGWGTELVSGSASQQGTTRIENWGATRLKIAAQVGSDVPLFLIGGTVLGLDRGQEVYPLPDIEPVWCVVALPPTGVSTPQAFRDWDALCTREGLTQETSAYKLNELSRAYARAFSRGGPGAGSSGVLSYGEDLAGLQESALVRTGITSWIQNDFERVVFPQHPSLAEIKRILVGSSGSEAARRSSSYSGPLVAMLSGSGSALFGLYPTRGDAERAVDRLQPVAGVEARITCTLPRTEYWGQMLSK